MSLEMLSAVGGGARSGNPDAAEPNVKRAQFAPMQSDKLGSGPFAAAQAETAQAVKPTPVSAHAARVDLAAEKTQGDAVFDYPVFGPDKFARVAAKHAIEEAESRDDQHRAIAEREAKAMAEKQETARVDAVKHAQMAEVVVEQSDEERPEAPVVEAAPVQAEAPAEPVSELEILEDTE